MNLRRLSAGVLTTAFLAGACAGGDTTESGAETRASERGGIGTSQMAIGSGPITIDERRSLAVTDTAILSSFSLSDVLNQLAAQSGVPGLTGTQLFRQLWDTQNHAPGLTSGPHCDDVLVNGQPSLNNFPYGCRTSDGAQANDPSTQINQYIAVGLFNRFDLAPTSGAAEFQSTFFPSQVAALAVSDINLFNYTVPDRFNTGESVSQAPSQNDYVAAFSPGSAFAANIQAQLNAIGSSLTPVQIVARAEALSCGGCHQLSNNSDLGGGLTWPTSAGFVHVTESVESGPEGERFQLSDALTNVFLPHRKQVFEGFLNAVNVVTLAVTKSGSGQGTVAGSGINCGADCAEGFASGTEVTLTAVSRPGSWFSGWSGGGCAGVGTCTVLMNAATSVTATFNVSPGGPRDQDFDGDGKSDILWRNETTGQVYLMQMDGFARRVEGPVYTEPDLAWKVAAQADFNGDGASDLLYRNDQTGLLYQIQMSGLAFGLQGVVYSVPDLAWKVVATADFDGDGNADILYRNDQTGMLYVLFMQGLAIVNEGVLYTEPNLDWKVIHTADFNGDGTADIVYRNDTTGMVYGLFLQGLNIVNQGVLWTEPDLAWQVIQAADFDGDSHADLLYYNSVTGQVHQLQFQGLTVKAQALVYTEPDTQWKIVTVGDYNGDGKADLLWRNEATGQVYMMLMDGLTILAGQFIYTEPNVAWKILGKY